MSLPDNRLSDFIDDSEYLSPDDMVFNPLSVAEYGGIDLQNAIGGLRMKIWTLRYEGYTKRMILETPGKYYIPIENLDAPDSIDLAFDQNMNYCICYNFGNNTYLKWFDTTVLTFVTNVFAGTRNAKLCIDDKRPGFENTSDIIFAYIKDNGDLCYRQQRDRFTTERLLRTGIPSECTLLKIGMTRGNRVKFDITKELKIPECEIEA